MYIVISFSFLSFLRTGFFYFEKSGPSVLRLNKPSNWTITVTATAYQDKTFSLPFSRIDKNTH